MHRIFAYKMLTKSSKQYVYHARYSERYIKDISRKIRASLRFKIEKGEYIGHAPFGYQKSPHAGNSLLVDEKAAEAVREIFNEYIKGYSYACIAKSMDEKGYPTPSGRNNGNHSASWSPVAVQRILSNRVYVGDTVQGISERISFKSKKARKLPESRWVVTENTHEALVSRELFEQVQRLKASGKRISRVGSANAHLFKGMIFCGRCGSPLYSRVRRNRPMGYVCGSYAKKGRSLCTSHFIREKELLEYITNELREVFQKIELENILIGYVKNELKGMNGTGIEIDKLEQHMFSKQKQQDVLYMDRLEGRISEQLFTRMNQSIENRISQLRHEIEKQRIWKADNINLESEIGRIRECLSSGALPFEVIRLMVHRITVFDEGDNTEALDLTPLSIEDKEAAAKSGLILIDVNSK